MAGPRFIMGRRGWGGDARTKVPVKFALFSPCVVQVTETIVKDAVQFYKTPGRKNVKGTVHSYGVRAGVPVSGLPWGSDYLS